MYTHTHNCCWDISHIFENHFLKSVFSPTCPYLRNPHLSSAKIQNISLASRFSKPAVYEHMADTDPGCKTHLLPGYTTPDLQQLPHIVHVHPTSHVTTPCHSQKACSWDGVLPTKVNHSLSSGMSSTLVGLHLSPPLPPANWAACLPARSTGGGGPLEVVTQQLVPATTAPGSLLLSYRATPRFHRGHSKVAGNLPLLRSLLPRAGQLAADLFLSAVACCTDLLTSVGGKGWRTKQGPAFPGRNTPRGPQVW